MERGDLTGKVQNAEHKNPENRHEMPIPGGHIHNNPLLFERLTEKNADLGIEERHHAASQVDGVSSCEELKERRAHYLSLENRMYFHGFPGHPLACQEPQAKKKRYGKPGKASAGVHCHSGD